MSAHQIRVEFPNSKRDPQKDSYLSFFLLTH